MLVAAKKIVDNGFALATVLLASTTLLTLLVVAVTAAASIRTTINDQYYQQIAQEAAESGLVYARYCYGVAASSATSTEWPKAGALQPHMTCKGAVRSGQTCPGTTSLCSVITGTGDVRSTFSVTLPSGSSGTASYILKSVGTAQLLRSDGTPFKTYTSRLNQRVSINLNGIASGNDTTCSIQSGQLYCWGKNESGQVGNGNTNTPVTVPYHVTNFPTVDGVKYDYVQYVATGIAHTCAVVGTTPNDYDGNRIFCWGDNSLGQFGNDTTTSSLTPRVSCYGTGTAKKCSGDGLRTERYTGCTSFNPDCIPISARDHTCSMSINLVAPGSPAGSAVFCWGKNTYGQAGLYAHDGPIPNPKRYAGDPIRINSSNGVLMYTTYIGNVSGDGACAVQSSSATNGAVFCWGTNSHGEFGNGTQFSGTKTAKAIAANVVNSGVTKVATNNAYACAIKTGGLYCWGANGAFNGPPDFRLDSGSAVSGTWHVDTPVQLVSATKYGGAVTDFAITDWNTCVIVNKKVYCSGYNNFGQLGQGNTNSYNSTTRADTGPTRAPGSATASQVRPAAYMVQVKGALADENVTEITSGNDHFCAITEASTAYCWGSNVYGQLGDGSTSSNALPTRVRIPANVMY